MIKTLRLEMSQKSCQGCIQTETKGYIKVLHSLFANTFPSSPDVSRDVYVSGFGKEIRNEKVHNGLFDDSW